MNFIREYKNAITDEFCDTIIGAFKHNKKLGCVVDRKDSIRKDNQQNFNSTHSQDQASGLGIDVLTEINMRNSALAAPFFEKLTESMVKYREDTLVQDRIGGVYCSDMLVQESIADNFDSYSTWHCEAGDRLTADRAFTYILYLNDAFEVGETQFNISET